MRVTQPLYRQMAVVLLFVAAQAVAAEAPAPDKGEERLREQALKLNDITGQDPMVGEIVALIKKKDETKKLLAVAEKMMKEAEKAKKEPPLNVNATYILARTAHGLDLLEQGEFFYRQHARQAMKLSSGQKLVRAYTGLISLLIQNKKNAEADKVCREFLEMPEDEVSKLQVMRLMVLNLAQMGKIDEALKTVNTLIKVRPRLLTLYDLKGRVLREGGKYDEAAKVYEELLDRVRTDKIFDRDKEARDEYSSIIRYRLSGIYIDLKKVEKATEHLKVLLAKEPDNPTYNNDLGFIWADHDMKLPEAEKMIRKALDEDRKLRRKLNPAKPGPDNAAYLDSLGWVLYKRKEYKKALPPLLEAIKQEEGKHIEIFDHLGEVYMALEEPGKAIEAWKKGVETKPLTKRDEKRKEDVQKKIKKFEGRVKKGDGD
jgi:tetratricopeptide (TPR) repeat protein